MCAQRGAFRASASPMSNGCGPKKVCGGPNSQVREGMIIPYDTNLASGEANFPRTIDRTPRMGGATAGGVYAEGLFILGKFRCSGGWCAL